MEPKASWARYRCACGFELARVPSDVLEDLPRCLGCGRALRARPSVRVQGVSSVRGLR